MSESRALATVDGEETAVALAPPRTTNEVLEDQQRIVECMEKVMQSGRDFGSIEGFSSGKPSLFKGGAEKLGVLFHLAAEPIVEDLSVMDEIRYRVTVRVTDQYTGAFLGAGIGECSTAEAKYAWRAAVCEEEYKEATPEQRREKWFKGKGNDDPYKQQQIRTVPADNANTVLKMGKKRAHVDAMLTVTAASSIFTQDLEDIDPELRSGTKSSATAAGASTGQRQQQTGPPADWKDNEARIITARVKDVRTKQGSNSRGEYTQTSVTFENGMRASGFDGSFPEKLQTAKNAGSSCKVVAKLQRKGRYLNLISIEDTIFDQTEEKPKDEGQGNGNGAPPDDAEFDTGGDQPDAKSG